MTQDEAEILDVVSPFLATEVVNKHNYKSHLNSKIVSFKIKFESVSWATIPVDLSGMKHLRSIEVAAKTTVPTHSHNGPLVRIITHGDATVNNVLYGPGDWMIIPQNVTYSISTETGYKALGICHMWGVGPEE